MTILNTSPVFCEGLIGTIGAVIAVISFVSMFMFLHEAGESGSGVCFIIGIICVALFIAGFVASVVDDNKPTGKYRYEILLDDSYPASKLNENYDVIEQRGEIFVIEDKEAIDK